MAEHVCPFWVGYLLASPLRKVMQNPSKILKPYIQRNMTVLDVGCAMGFFSLPMAERVRPGGLVICVDIQEKMLGVLEKKARRAGLSAFIETRVTGAQSLNLTDLEDKIDFALAFAVLHEAGEPSRFLSEIHHTLKAGGKLMLSEPKGHVKQAAFEQSAALVEDQSFKCIGRPAIRRCHTALFEKN
jgi:2-polyprenyl-3-methyl-5-hydroxy-6-metoxy-1,4-benzoquinol methylase